jgi:hypothetical protein
MAKQVDEATVSVVVALAHYLDGAHHDVHA